MKGCAFRALLSWLGLAVIVGVIGVALVRQYGLGPTDVVGVALLSGLASWISANLLVAAIKAGRERAALRAGIAGRPPVDGRSVILVGHIEPAGPLLRAPLSGRACLAYTFEVSERRRVGNRRLKIVLCDGVALTPSTIVTAGGSFRLLAVPELVCDETDLDRDTALTRAAEQMRTLPFEPRPTTFSRPAIEQQWNDDDGAYQRGTRRIAESEVELAECRLSERCLESGTRVCVFGSYSEARRAIVAAPGDWSKITRVMKGDANAIATQLGSSIVRRIIGATLFAGAAGGVVAAYVASLP